MTALQWGALALAATGGWAHMMLVVGLAKGSPDDRLRSYAAAALLGLVGAVLLAAGGGGWPEGLAVTVAAGHLVGGLCAVPVFRRKQRPAPTATARSEAA